MSLQAEEERPQLCGLYSNIFHLLSYVMVIFEQDFLKINIFLKQFFPEHMCWKFLACLYVCLVTHIQQASWQVGGMDLLLSTYKSLLNLIFFFILFLGLETLGHFFFFPAEIADDGLASYHTSVKEENLMSGHVQSCGKEPYFTHRQEQQYGQQ